MDDNLGELWKACDGKIEQFQDTIYEWLRYNTDTLENIKSFNKVQKSSLKKTVKKLKQHRYSEYQGKSIEQAKEEEEIWLKVTESAPVPNNDFSIKVPFHLSLKFFSFMNGYELLTKAAKLNKRYRKELPDNALLD